ncbi:hypothetical protein [Methylomonas methanica]|nr:hypothetical protein [Methylomonas methanica]
MKLRPASAVPVVGMGVFRHDRQPQGRQPLPEHSHAKNPALIGIEQR